MRPCYLHVPHTPRTVIPTLLKQYYGETNVLDTTPYSPEDAEELELLLQEAPENFDKYQALCGTFRRDRFKNFDPAEFNFFSVVFDPAVRAWYEYASEPRGVTFEHWVKYDSRPNVVCYYLTGYKPAGVSEFQTLVRLTNFQVCTPNQSPKMFNALGRFHGWSQLQYTPCSFIDPSETLVIPPRERDLVYDHHPADYAVFKWLLSRSYQF